MNKKLLLFNTSLGNGGAERQMLMLIHFLNEKGIVPHVLTYCDPKNDYPNDARMIRHNVQSSNKLIRNIRLVIAIIRLRPDVLLSYTGDPNHIACLYKRVNKRCRVVVSERNIVELPLSDQARKFYELYSNVDMIVSNSQEQYDRLVQAYPSYQDKLIVIRNYTKVPDHLEEHKETANDKIVVSIFARYHAQKNVTGFLQAVAKVNKMQNCPPFECKWYGRNTSNGALSSYYKKCKVLQNELGLTNVELFGYTEHTKELMQNADVVCLPSFKEGFSNSLSEAICLGKPILASNVSDNHFFVEDSKNGYLMDPKNIDDMAEKLYTILCEQNMYKAYGEVSYRKACILFDKNEFIESYIKALYI